MSAPSDRLRVFAVVMSVVYILFGCALIFTDVLKNSIVHYRNVIGGVLVGYGALRLIMWYLKRPAS